MPDFKSEIANAIAAAVASKEFDSAKVESFLEIPPDKTMGDYAFPCFKLAGILKKSPPAIADDLKKKIKLPGGIEKAEIKGPYLNFFVEKAALAGNVLPKIMQEKENYGKSSKQKEKIGIEFCHANTHKAFHIGHVRNISLGECLCRIFEFLGYKVYRLNYEGDVGPHVSKCLWQYMGFEKGKEPQGIAERGRWLGYVYSEGAKKVEGNPELEQEMRNLTKRLFEGDNELKKIWETTRKWSLDYYNEIYKDFGVKFDRLYFESEMEKRGQEIARELLKKGVAEEDEGAILMDLEKHGLGKFIILKSDDMPLYSTKDLALAEIKFKEYPIDMSFHVVGSEQEFYFKQLIKTLEIVGYPQAKKTVHIEYGLVTLKEGKMSSRLGNVIVYSDLFDKMYSKTLEEVKKRYVDWDNVKIENTARQIALAAIKFGMLNRDNRKVIEFDWEKALALEGETGPYLQYSYARARSILRKEVGSPKKADLSLLKEQTEKELISLLAEFPFAIEQSGRNYAALPLCQYLIKLSEKFNSFYHQLPVMQAEEKLKNARLELVRTFTITMQNGLFCLGIQGLEEM